MAIKRREASQVCMIPLYIALIAALTFWGFTFASTSATFLLTNAGPSNACASAVPSPSASTKSSFLFSLTMTMISSLRAESAFRTVVSPPCSAAYAGCASSKAQRSHRQRRVGATHVTYLRLTHLQRRKYRGIKPAEEAQGRPENQDQVFHGHTLVFLVPHLTCLDDGGASVYQESEDGASKSLELVRNILLGEDEFLIVVTHLLVSSCDYCALMWRRRFLWLQCCNGVRVSDSLESSAAIPTDAKQSLCRVGCDGCCSFRSGFFFAKVLYRGNDEFEGNAQQHLRIPT